EHHPLVVERPVAEPEREPVLHAVAARNLRHLALGELLAADRAQDREGVRDALRELHPDRLGEDRRRRGEREDEREDGEGLHGLVPPEPELPSRVQGYRQQGSCREPRRRAAPARQRLFYGSAASRTPR